MARTGKSELYKLSAIELRALIGQRKLSPIELLDHLLARIDRLDPKIHAFVHLDRRGAKAAACKAERAMMSGELLGPLHGLPISIKDLILVKGMPCTRGSWFFRNDVPKQDPPAIERLRKAGAIITGKTNTPELGWKGASSNVLFPETRNPWNLERTPGGSSGGATAATAVGFGPFHIGSDGGGSIRIPASFTGTFGFKASYGRIPNSPVAPNGRIGHLGPQTRTVDDAALLYRVLAGPDERDPHSLPADTIAEGDPAPLEGLRIGWAPDLGFLKADAEVVRICERAVQKFADARCTIVPLKINIEDPLESTIGIAMRAGIGRAVTGFPDWQKHIDPGLGDVVERAAATMSPFALADAALGIGRISEALRRHFAKVDILALPTTPTVAFPIGQDAPTRWLKVPEGATRWFGLTAAFNATGQPAASVPAGFTRAGLPVGLQLVGRRYDDWTVMRICKTFEELAPWRDKWPKAATR